MQIVEDGEAPQRLGRLARLFHRHRGPSVRCQQGDDPAWWCVWHRCRCGAEFVRWSRRRPF
jgi:hypothetical protein